MQASTSAATIFAGSFASPLPWKPIDPPGILEAMTMKLASTIAFLFFLSTSAFAQDTEHKFDWASAIVFSTVQGFDVWTTHRARASGNGIEANPLMDVGTGQQIAIKAGATAGIVWLVHKVGRTRPKLAKGLLYGLSAAVAGVAMRNESIARRR